MPTTIPWLTGVTASGHFLATVSATENTVTVQPLNPEKHTMVVNLADNVTVNPTMKKLLDRAGLQPPPPGKLLSIAHVNQSLTNAKMLPEERMEVKAALVRLGIVEQGRPVNIFDTGGMR